MLRKSNKMSYYKEPVGFENHNERKLDSEFLDFHLKVRQDCIDRNISCVKYYEILPEVAFYMFEDYRKHNRDDEFCLKQPLSQRVIGAHTDDYDYNFFMCRLFGFAKINPDVSHDIYGEDKYRLQLNDQQHALDFEYEVINNDLLIDIEKFQDSLKVVVAENGVQDNDPILLEIEQWIEKATKEGQMVWSQVRNSVDKYPLIKEKQSEAINMEFLYSNARPATNKTQKRNDNPFGWKDWNKTRNQLTLNKSLYEYTFTNINEEEPYDVEWFKKESLKNKFFSETGDKFIKRNHIATIAQPSGQVDNGEIQCAWFKLLFSFIDDEGNIDFTNRSMDSETFDIINDTEMYSYLDKINKKWNLLSDNLEENKENILTLRKYFFDFFDSISDSCKLNTSSVVKYNKYTKERAQACGENGKLVGNLRDIRLTKLENVLWVMKSCIAIKHKQQDKSSMHKITNRYINKLTQKTMSNELLSRGVNGWEDRLTKSPTSSAGRYKYLDEINEKMKDCILKSLKEDKVETDEMLRDAHDELFSIAKQRYQSDYGQPFDETIYYWHPQSNKNLVRDNTDLGHDLLKKLGRPANMETTFIQYRKENRKWNKGAFPKPVDYYKSIIAVYNNIESSQEYTEAQKFSVGMHKRLLNIVVDIYESNQYKAIGKKYGK